MPECKKIFINASTVKYSGGLYIGLDIIRTLIECREFKIMLVCPRIPAYKEFEKLVTIRYVPEFFYFYLFRPILDFIRIRKYINKFNPDKIISLGNLPAVSRFYQIFFHDNAFISGNYKNLIKLGLIQKIRRRIFNSRLKYVDKIIVQTQLEKQNLEISFSDLPVVKVIPPMLPSHLLIKTPIKEYSHVNSGFQKILCLSRYYRHKNIEILYEAAELCYNKLLPVQFIITVDTSQGRKARQLLQKIKKNDFGKRIINIGEIKREHLSAVINKVDAFILPSLVETFGLNCIEAWYFSKPLFIADLPYARHICNDAAVYFDPFDADNLTDQIIKYSNHTPETEKILKNGKEKLNSLSKPEDIIELMKSDRS
ncbi:MAG: glycosyltransferase [Bacteroidales bacterium]|nr:glycosyltransferase [Bacteroidales bacterium]